MTQIQEQELLIEIKDIRLYHELCVQKCIKLEKKLAAVSTVASKKTFEQKVEEFKNSEQGRLVLLNKRKRRHIN